MFQGNQVIVMELVKGDSLDKILNKQVWSSCRSCVFCRFVLASVLRPFLLWTDLGHLR